MHAHPASDTCDEFPYLPTHAAHMMWHMPPCFACARNACCQSTPSRPCIMPPWHCAARPHVHVARQRPTDPAAHLSHSSGRRGQWSRMLRLNVRMEKSACTHITRGSIGAPQPLHDYHVARLEHHRQVAHAHGSRTCACRCQRPPIMHALACSTMSIMHHGRQAAGGRWPHWS